MAGKGGGPEGRPVWGRGRWEIKSSRSEGPGTGRRRQEAGRDSGRMVTRRSVSPAPHASAPEARTLTPICPPQAGPNPRPPPGATRREREVQRRTVRGRSHAVTVRAGNRAELETVARPPRPPAPWERAKWTRCSPRSRPEARWPPSLLPAARCPDPRVFLGSVLGTCANPGEWVSSELSRSQTLPAKPPGSVSENFNPSL